MLTFTRNTDFSPTGKRILLSRTHHESHLIQDVTLKEYTFPVDTAVSESRYLRVTESKLIIEPLSLEELVVLRRKPMTTPTLKPNRL